MAPQKQKRRENAPEALFDTLGDAGKSKTGDDGWMLTSEKIRGLVPKRVVAEGGKKDFGEEPPLGEELVFGEGGEPLKRYTKKKIAGAADVADEYLRVTARGAIEMANKFLSPLSDMLGRNRRDVG